MEKIIITEDEVESLLDTLDKIFGESNDSTNDEKLSKQEIFDNEFMSSKYDDRFAGAVAMVMSISTFTNIPLEEVFEMYIEKMREELEGDDTKVAMSIGKMLMGLADNE